jgi:hypothetical protein
MDGVRRIFFDVATGERITEVGRGEGMVIPAVEQDIATYTALSERNRSTFDVIELPFGAYQQDFAECNGYRVNVETKELEFSYPNPGQPVTEPVYQKPLSEQIAQLKSDNDDLKATIDTILTDILPSLMV